MNLLIALHGDFTANAASHVDGLARELCAAGHDCTIAVPSSLRGDEHFAPYPYRAQTFDQVLSQPQTFRNGGGPDILHLWTPREHMRKFRNRLRTQIAFRTVIHLEDNETHITEVSLGKADWGRIIRGDAVTDFPEGLTHPTLSKPLMEEAAGFTLLIATLGSQIPPEKPRIVFWPAADPLIFHPRERNDTLRQTLGLRPDECVLAYHGNTHRANFAEVRSLYLAVALLNRTGIPARLVRTGINWCPQSPEYNEWAARYTIDLGRVADRRSLVDYLATADIFVQPGSSDIFNDYRFPSKLPEFFALGRPVVLPRTNIGLVTRHLEDAYVLDQGTGAGIRDAVAHIWSDVVLREKLARGAIAFAASHFSWRRAALDLAEFYRTLLVS